MTYAEAAQQQTEYLSAEAHDLGYDTITDLFLEEPELYDRIAAEWREAQEQQ